MARVIGHGRPRHHEGDSLISRSVLWGPDVDDAVPERDVGDADDTTPGNESLTRLRAHVSYIDDTPSTHSR